MPIPGTVQVTGIIAPTSSSDTYPVTDAQYGLDGLRSVADHSTRNAIPNARRRYGMLVFTQNDGLYWTLNNSPWTGTDSDWTQLSLSGTGTVNAYRLAFTYSSLISGILNVTHNLGQQYVTVSVYDDNNYQIIPDQVQLLSSTQLNVDVTSFGNITGTWNLVVMG